MSGLFLVYYFINFSHVVTMTYKKHAQNSSLISFLNSASQLFKHDSYSCIVDESLKYKTLDALVCHGHLHYLFFTSQLTEDFPFYSRQSYVILTENPCEVMDQAERFLATKSKGSMIAHWTKFLIISTSQSDSYIKLSNNCLHKSHFDNILVVQYFPSSLQITSLHTLMWGQDNSRYLTDISAVLSRSQLHVSDLYPNSIHGMNGKKLVCACKEWPKDIEITRSVKTGQINYTGLLVELVELISKEMNFSCKFEPEPQYPTNMTWDEHSSFVGNGGADMALNVYPQESEVLTNFSVGFPIFYNHLVGIHLVGEVNHHQTSFLNDVYLFKYLILFCGCLAFTLFNLILFKKAEKLEKHNYDYNVSISGHLREGQGGGGTTES